MVKVLFAVALLATIGWLLRDELPFGDSEPAVRGGPSVGYPVVEQEAEGPVEELGSETGGLLD